MTEASSLALPSGVGTGQEQLRRCIVIPELPEVETIRLGLQQYLVGHTILDVEIRLPKIVEGNIAKVIGAKVIGVRRFGKGLVIDLDNEYCIAVHIKLTGQLIYENQELRIKNHGKVKIIKNTFGGLPHKWTHVIFKLKAQNEKRKINKDADAYLFYNDFRQFGWIKIIKSSKLKEQSFFRDLGPELIPSPDSGQARMTKDMFAEIVKKTKGPIKPLLLDQKKIAGIGNIYANDGLYDAKIDPRRKANTLSSEEIDRLYTSLIKVLQKGLEAGGASELSYVNALGQEGNYQKHFLVYAQDGKPCQRDGTIIEKIMLGGRGTYFCPKCQK